MRSLLQKEHKPFMFARRTKIEASRGGNRKRHRACHRIVIGPDYNEELAMQSRRHEPNTTLSLKESSGATEGVLDYGVLGCPGNLSMGRTDGLRRYKKAFPRVRMGHSF